MQLSKTLHLYSTSRAIRVALEEFKKQNQILPKLMSIGEFEQKAVLVKRRVFIDDDTRVLLLQKACDFEEFKKLQIPTEFLSFLKNSKFIFSFLDELSHEKIDIEQLQSSDTYLEYSEHIELLKKVRENYISILDDNGYVDKLLLPSLYELNSNFLKSFEKIVLHLDGYQTKYEEELFEKISSLVELEVIKKDTPNNNPNIVVESFTQPLMQVAFIKQKVYEFLKKGIKPQNLAVVLPDKSFGIEIKNFDYENNFNLAFGYSYTTSLIYKKLDALYQFLSEKSQQNLYRYKRYININFEVKEDFFSSLEQIIDEFDEVYEEEKYLFLKLLPHLETYPFIKKLHLFLNRLSKRTLDDVKGGKVTILEVLETRGVEYEAIIIPNFNEDVIPKKIKKDMFISSSLRKKVGLPTIKQREQLQKNLYKNIIFSAKEVAISYVDDEQNSKSRFLDELELDYKVHNRDESLYLELLFNSTTQKEITQKEIILPYDFTKVELSSSRLKTFLECKRKYYYRYIKKLYEVTIPSDEITPKDIGDMVHEALFEVYSKKPYFFDKDELLLSLQENLYKKISNNIVLKFHIDLWLKRFHSFCEKEVERFEKGYKIFGLEKELKTTYKGLKLVGKVDRIDIKDDTLFVLDYKTGKLPKTTKKDISEGRAKDFQLQFYYHLSSSLGKTFSCAFYDLTNSKVIEEDFFDEKLEMLDKILDELKEANVVNFSLSEDEKSCTYCPYVKMCGRE